MKGLFMTLLACAIAAPAMAGSTQASKDEARIERAQEVLTAAVTAPDKGIPKGLLKEAECVGVFPDLTKGAFIVGGEYGKGVFTCRKPDGTMGPPAFFTIGGGSVGWQFGGKQADLVLLIMNPGGVKHVLEDHFTLGGEAAAVAGPVGRTADAATDAQLHAQILSWSRSHGIFLGASLAGDVIEPDKDATRAFYGKPLTARQILVEHEPGVPPGARSFVQLATRYTHRELSLIHI